MAAIVLLVLTASSFLVSQGLRMDDNFVTTNTTSGTVRGTVDRAAVPPVIRFLGIPFAKPPKHNLRFRPPQEPESWSGVRDMFNTGKRCMQLSLPGRNTNMSVVGEDCLFLNIFYPETPKKSLPVMVWIHGGGYTIGTGNKFDGSLLAQKGVMVVTINYRLDLFGFLSMEDDSLPGNYGMLDQIAALKWVQKNIANFGGDPKQVTVFGESAGASSVDLLILSPLAKGLFTKAILQSGVAFCPWGYQHPGNRVSAKSFARMIALTVNCTDLDNPGKLLSCLQRVGAWALMRASFKVTKSFKTQSPLSPRVETTFGFLPKFPHVLLEKGTFNHVDTIHGFCSDESEYFIARNKEIKTSLSDEVKTEKTMKLLLNRLTDRDQDIVYKVIRAHYITNDSSTQKRQSLESQDDIGFLGPILADLNAQVLKAPEKNHYVYEFNHRPSYSTFRSWVSATHAQDLRFVFGFDLFKNGDNSLQPSAGDYQVLQMVTEMWTNFAKTSNPVCSSPPGVKTWTPFTKAEPKYLVIKPGAEQKTLLEPSNLVYSKFSKVFDGFSFV